MCTHAAANGLTDCNTVDGDAIFMRANGTQGAKGVENVKNRTTRDGCDEPVGTIFGL